MSLQILPPELLAMIIEKLDTKSIFNLYEAGVECLQGLVTECHFSANTLATAKSLKTEFFNSISLCLRVLNLSGITDLYRPTLLDALRSTTNLIDLNVSYTNIIMPDFLEIAAATPTLKNIAINFAFVEGKGEFLMEEVLCRVRDQELGSYQRAFERFENVHFVGRLHARVHGALALLVLQRAALASLTFTTTGAAEGYRFDLSSWTASMVNTKLFQLFFYKISRRRPLIETQIFNVMDFKKYEAIIFYDSYRVGEFCIRDNMIVFATPLLKKFISERYSVDIVSLPDPLSREGLANKIASLKVVAEVDFACLFWDAERVVFDDTFRSKLLKIFRQYKIFDADTAMRAPQDHNWYRVATNPQNTLDYGEQFRRNEKVKLIVTYNKKLQQNTSNVNNTKFLKKITHLYLSGDLPRNPSYYETLFTSCSSLETLYISLDRFNSEVVLQHLKKAESLKNIFVSCITLRHVCGMFRQLSLCYSLENICVCSAFHAKLNQQGDLITLLTNLRNLYNFCMRMTVTRGSKAIDESIRKLKLAQGRDALQVQMFLYTNFSPYHPSLSAFDQVCRLKPLKSVMF